MTRRGTADSKGHDLFSAAGDAARLQAAPLAERMRPACLDEVVGQDHVLGPGRVLRDLIEGGSTPSLLLWGPPGTGKTTLARVIAASSNRRLICLSAVESGVKDVRRAVGEARETWRFEKRGSLLFVDEIHRFNRAQQDVLLPHVEDGTFSFIGATTENPSFQVVAPLLSRCRLIVLRPLEPTALVSLLRRALSDPERGLTSQVEADDASLAHLAALADGDARAALGLLEMAAFAARQRGSDSSEDDDHQPAIEERDIQAAALRKLPRYDKSGEEHYNVISALHKSVRGSDPDAALYWLARMLESGEDPLYVARRVVRMASEDVGNADPRGLGLAVAAMQTVQWLGMPEAALALAQAVSWLALAPKSNAIESAYAAAAHDATHGPSLPVPPWLRNAPTQTMKDLGYGKGYLYPHDYLDSVVPQGCFPEGMEPRPYYQPRDMGAEALLAQRRERIAALKESLQGSDLRARRRPPDKGPGDGTPNSVWKAPPPPGGDSAPAPEAPRS